MTQTKIFLDALNGVTTPRVPFWYMRQAGRYLPEYRELRAEKGGFLNMVYDPEAACEVTLQPIRRFHMDAAILFSDILVIPHALGQHLEFMAGEGPKLDPIRDRGGLSILKPGKIDATLSPIYDTIRNIRKGLEDEGYGDVATIGFAGSPWTVACYMVEGQGSKDYMAVKNMAYSDPETFGALIDIVVEATSEYLIEQVNAGAEVLQLFDSWSGALDAAQFRKWVIEPTAKIVAAVRSVHPHVPIIGFPRGSGPNYIAYARDSGVSALGVDPQFAPEQAAKTLQTLLPVQGNLDPACLLAGGDALRRNAEEVLSALSGGPFVFNLGHGINKETPIAHVEMLSEIIKNWKNA